MNTDKKGTKTFSYNLRDRSLKKRYDITLQFVKKHLKIGDDILDLGIDNPLAQIMRDNGYKVSNTLMHQDLDEDYDIVRHDYDCVTAFEIFEHQLAPYNLLKAINAKKLICSVPLRLWFSKAYWNTEDEWDRHYHEFEPRQFDMLLSKTGWTIKDSKKWKPPFKLRGIRPILRSITNRYYIVYCERK